MMNKVENGFANDDGHNGEIGWAVAANLKGNDGSGQLITVAPAIFKTHNADNIRC